MDFNVNAPILFVLVGIIVALTLIHICWPTIPVAPITPTLYCFILTKTFLSQTLPNIYAVQTKFCTNNKKTGLKDVYKRQDLLGIIHTIGHAQGGAGCGGADKTVFKSGKAVPVSYTHLHAMAVCWASTARS